jgi:hypothetical protein
MSAVAIPIWSRLDSLTNRARSIRELARQRHVLAVRHLEMGDRGKFLELLRDVSAHEDEARRLESQRDGILAARRETTRALEHILAVMQAGRCT